MEINWCGYSYSKALFLLMNKALQCGMDYLHIIQGADLPIKTPEEIDSFFTANSSKNFILLYTDQRKDKWVIFKHPFIDNQYYRKSDILKAIDNMYCRL